MRLRVLRVSIKARIMKRAKSELLVSLPLAALLSCTCSSGGANAGRLKDSPNSSDDVTRGVWFSGLDFAKGAEYQFLGTIVSLSGDLSKSGPALRVYGSHLTYDLDPGTGTAWQGDGMLGYAFNRGKYSGGVYAGVDVQNFRLSPDDPTARVRGTETGFKVSADVETSKEDLPYYFNLNGNYSTAFQSYWARARAGWNLHKNMTFGPEVIALGSIDFDAQRVGAFASFKLEIIPHRPLELTISGGHQFVSHSGGSSSGSNNGATPGGGEGTYVGIALGADF